MSAAKSQAKNGSNIFPLIIIPVLFVVSLLIFFFVLGNPSNFNQELLKEGKHEPVEHGVGGLGKTTAPVKWQQKLPRR